MPSIPNDKCSTESIWFCNKTICYGTTVGHFHLCLHLLPQSPHIPTMFLFNQLHQFPCLAVIHVPCLSRVLQKVQMLPVLLNCSLFLLCRLLYLLLYLRLLSDKPHVQTKLLPQPFHEEAILQRQTTMQLSDTNPNPLPWDDFDFIMNICHHPRTHVMSDRAKGFRNWNKNLIPNSFQH